MLTAIIVDNTTNMMNVVDIAFGRKKHITSFILKIQQLKAQITVCWQNIVSKFKAIVTWFEHGVIVL